MPIMSDDVKNLKTDNSAIDKGDLEMLDMIFKDEEKVKGILTSVKPIIVSVGLFYVLNLNFITTLISRMAGGSDKTLFIKTIIFAILLIMFR